MLQKHITLFLCLFVSFCWGQELSLSNDSRMYVAPSGMTVAAKGGVTLKDAAGLVNSAEVVLSTGDFFKLASPTAYLEAAGIAPNATANFISGISNKAQIDLVLTQGVGANFKLSMATVSDPEIAFLPVAWKLQKTVTDPADKCNLMFYWDPSLASEDQQYNTLYQWSDSENQWKPMPTENTTVGSETLVYLGMEGSFEEAIFAIGPSADPDTDGDGIPDSKDPDDENDSVNDTSDVFPLDPSEWADTDGDGIGNNADADDDNDGYSDLDELTCGSNPLDRFKKPADQDQDGLADCVDSDRDGDGIENTQDVFPDDATEWQDTDGDGLGDNFEVDDDNDGVLDSMDAFPLDPAEWADADGDGIGDNADPDDNNDGFEDNQLFVSGVLTPNSSGLESTWKIINLDKYPNARVTVYNKNGQKVFSAQGYRNDWSGTYKDSSDPLPASSYYYVLELNTGEEPITGWLFLTY